MWHLLPAVLGETLVSDSDQDALLHALQAAENRVMAASKVLSEVQQEQQREDIVQAAKAALEEATKQFHVSELALQAAHWRAIPADQRLAYQELTAAEYVWNDEEVSSMHVLLPAHSWETMENDLQTILNEYMENWHNMGEAALREVEKREKESGLNRQHPDFNNDGIAIDLLRGGQPIWLSRAPLTTPVTVGFNDRVWPNATFTWKGASSLVGADRVQSYKRGFYLDFADGLDFFGHKRLVLAPNYLDPSFVREKLASDVFRRAGLNAGRAALYRVYIHIDGAPTYWGLYTLLEDLSDKLPLSFVGDTAPGSALYQPENSTWTVPFRPDNFPLASLKKTETQLPSDSGDSSTHLISRAFAALHDSMRLSQPQQWRLVLEAVLDVASFITYIAVCAATSNWDSFGIMPHNYYLYTLNGRLTWVPVDHNLAFSMTPSNIVMPSIMRDESEGAKWPLVRFVLDDTVYRNTYIQELSWLVSPEGPLFLERLEGRAKKLLQLAKPHVVGQQGEEPIEGEQKPITLLEDIEKEFLEGERELLSMIRYSDARVAVVLEEHHNASPGPAHRRRAFHGAFGTKSEQETQSQLYSGPPKDKDEL